MVSKLYFEETFSLATAQALQAWADVNLITQVPSGDNPYLEPVNIPVYDSGDTTHVLITTSNGNESLLNDVSKQHFYVEPGVYAGGWVLTENGTDINRRTISLYNGNDTHPGALPTNEIAVLDGILFENADYWTIDRMSFTGTGDTHADSQASVLIWKGASDNIINRQYCYDFFGAVHIGRDSDRNTVQECRWEDQTLNARKADIMVTMIKNLPYNSRPDYYEAFNNKFILNESKNCNDAFHSSRSWRTSELPAKNNREDGDLQGTIIDDNDYYITSEIYTDGNGNTDETGAYAIAENAIDIKIASKNTANPFIVTNNRFWGFRRSDPTIVSLGDNGFGIILHYGLNNLEINNNIIFDSNGGIGSGDVGTETYDMRDSKINDNTIIDTAETRVQWSARPIVLGSDLRVECKRNVVFDARLNSMSFTFNGNGMDVTDNVSVNSTIVTDTDIVDSVYTSDNYGDGVYAPNTVYADATTGGYTEDYVFTTDKYTSSPRVITLTNVVKP